MPDSLNGSRLIKINPKFAGFGSRVLVKKFGDNMLTNYWNLKTLNVLLFFQGLTRSWKKKKFFSMAFQALWPSWKTPLS